MNNQNLDIIIVNWNSGELLLNCINSILINNSCKFNINIIIVDNNSSDNSLDKIPTNKNIKIIRLENNIGFGGACNIGVESCTSELILFLNPDVIVPENVLCKTISFFNKNKYSVIGIKQINQNNIIARTCARKPTLVNVFNHSTGLYKINKLFKSYKMTDWDHSNSSEVEHVIGSFYLMLKQDFLIAKGFDERFFLYYEDFDLSLKIRSLNKKIYYWTDEFVYHEGGGTTKNILDKRLYLSQKSKLLFFKKHFSTFKYILIFIVIVFFEFLIRLFLSIILFRFKQSNQIIKAYKMLYNSL